MRKHDCLFAALFAALSLGGCGHLDSPSMMNPNKPQLAEETAMTQVPVAQATQGYLSNVADQYKRYGTDTLQLALAYDPASKNYTAMQAFKDLSRIKSVLANMGVTSVRAETVKSNGTDPTLMISYDGVRAFAPEGCRSMPGLENGLTTREIGDYKFGCSIDAMTAQQLYHPSDLAGRAASDPIDGRRAANNIEYNRDVTQDEAEGELKTMGREDLKSQ